MLARSPFEYPSVTITFVLHMPGLPVQVTFDTCLRIHLEFPTKMEAYVDTLCLLAQPKEGQQQQFKNKKQPELTENQTVWKSDNQGHKEETFIQTGRRGRDWQLGQRGLAVRWRLVDPARWRIVEWGRPGCSYQTPQHGGWQTLWPHIRIDKLGGTVRERTDCETQGSIAGEIKPQNSD